MGEEFRRQSERVSPGLFEGNLDPQVMKARETPAGFADVVSGGRWMCPPHLALLNDKLLAVSRGEINRLMIYMPPRHGKSEFASKYFPAWFLGKNPERRVILASYEADFAASWGRKCRDLTEIHGPDIFSIGVDQRSHAADNWLLTNKIGGMVTAGVGGPITGKGADLLVIDDPVKNAEAAASATQREIIWDWYTSTAYTRLEPGGSVILIMTRWHDDDLAGRLLKDSNEEWTVLRLPAVAEDADDALGREIGEPLWEERYDNKRLDEIRGEIGPHWWAALYQQRPTVAEGAIFQREWLRRFEVDPESWSYRLYGDHGGPHTVETESCWRLITVDVAASLKETADYFVVAVWAVTPQSDLLLLDLLRQRVEGPRQVKLIQDYFRAYRPAFVGVESHGYQLALFQALVAEGIPAKELKTKGDKVARAQTAAARYEQGKVYHRMGASWLNVLEDELLRFPTGKHDDMVDAVAYAALLVAEQRPPRIRVAGR